MKTAQLGFFKWYWKTLRKQYKQAQILDQIKRENPTVTIEDDVLIVSPQNLVLGKHIIIQKGTILHCGGMQWSNYRGKITIGDNCEIGPSCILYGAGEIQIQRGVGIAMGVRVLSQGGDIDKLWEEGRDFSSSDIHLNFAKVILEEGSWIAANAIILPGVTVGRGALITPGAVVHKDVPPLKMAVAPPARILQSAPREQERKNT